MSSSEDSVDSTVTARRDKNGVYHVVAHNVTDHAAELAHALEAMIAVCDAETSAQDRAFMFAETVLKTYKQSRGES